MPDHSSAVVFSDDVEDVLDELEREAREAVENDDKYNVCVCVRV